ncbi:hypothetical protein D3OALGA1CA_5160 [Olavius algarvensis associated proteobacterium Delta 3]|nr:hypothetical protein D3OALGB2SA_3016 [Olavius algarvensis associated proteobacterium Delta 3]CAB5162747.1 hypothetical protein D3OALGA1CA_5160 [Olavius algarvensis associated proteobacterium Delta 3]
MKDGGYNTSSNSICYVGIRFEHTFPNHYELMDTLNPNRPEDTHVSD